jgi:hypothetical protein
VSECVCVCVFVNALSFSFPEPACHHRMLNMSQTRTAAAFDDGDADVVEPCFYCESHQHSSIECPKTRLEGKSWMYKAQKLFESRRGHRDPETVAGGGSNSNGGSIIRNRVREAAGSFWHCDFNSDSSSDTTSNSIYLSTCF